MRIDAAMATYSGIEVFKSDILAPGCWTIQNEKGETIAVGLWESKVPPNIGQGRRLTVSSDVYDKITKAVQTGR